MCPRTFASLSVNSKVIIGLSRVRTFLPDSMRAYLGCERDWITETEGDCGACGKRGADVRPDFNWDKKQVRATGYR